MLLINVPQEAAAELVIFPQKSWNPNLKEHCEMCAQPEQRPSEKERQSIMYACPGANIKGLSN